MLDCDYINCALEAVEDLGLNTVDKIGIFTRTWEEKLGIGDPNDTVEYLSPLPRVETIRKDQSNELGGSIKKGDIRISHLSKSSYQEADIDCVSNEQLVEKYYYIKGDLWEPVAIEERPLYYIVTVRKAKKRTLYLEG